MLAVIVFVLGAAIYDDVTKGPYVYEVTSVQSEASDFSVK